MELIERDLTYSVTWENETSKKIKSKKIREKKGGGFLRDP
jgi:hypothetical protein